MYVYMHVCVYVCGSAVVRVTTSSSALWCTMTTLVPGDGMYSVVAMILLRPRDGHTERTLGRGSGCPRGLGLRVYPVDTESLRGREGRACPPSALFTSMRSGTHHLCRTAGGELYTQPGHSKHVYC